MRILELNEDTKKDILSNLLKRSPNSYGEYEGRVNAIIENVKANGDEAVFSYTEQFDGYKLTSDNIVVTDEEIDEEIENVVMAQYSKAIELLNNAMPKLHEVARVLFEKEKISGEEFRSMMEN